MKDITLHKNNVEKLSLDNHFIVRAVVSFLIFMTPFSMGPVPIIGDKNTLVLLFFAFVLAVICLDDVTFHKNLFGAKYKTLTLIFAASFFLSLFFGLEYVDLSEFTMYKSTFLATLMEVSLIVPIQLAIIYIIYLSVKSIDDVLFYIKMFLNSGILINIITLITILSNTAFSKEGRLSVTFYDANYLGRFEVFIVILSLIYLLFFKINSIKKIYLSVNVVFSLYVLVMTYSRAAVLTLLIVISIIVLFYKSKTVKYSFILVSVIGFFYMIVFVASRRGVNAAGGILTSFLDLSNSTRLALNYSAVQMFFDYPIFGIGYHNFYNIYINNNYVPDFIPVSLTVSVVHSWFFSILAEQGIFGFIPFCALVYLLFKNLYESIKHPFNEQFKLAGLCLFAMFFVFIFNGLFFPVFFPEILFSLLFGIIAGFLKLVKLNELDITASRSKHI